jgi:hypothetical protein
VASSSYSSALASGSGALTDSAGETFASLTVFLLVIFSASFSAFSRCFSNLVIWRSC